MSGSSVRAVTRIARRSLLCDRWRAVLIVVLIGLPVMGITTAALLLQTAIPTPAERAVRTMGRADMRVEPLGDFGRAELRPVLPQGSQLEPVRTAYVFLPTPGRRLDVTVEYQDPNGLAAGMLTLVGGRAPAAPDEVAVSAALARSAGVVVGGTLDLGTLGTMRVVGEIEDARAIGRLVALGDSSLAEQAGATWLVALPAGASPDQVADDIRSAVPSGKPADGSGAYQMFDASTRQEAGQASETFTTFVVLLGVLALVEAALVASAAFAVGIRRRQRELGLLGAVGASPRQLAGSVLAEGLLAGLGAVIAGIGLGVAVAWLIGTRLDELTGQRAGPVEIDPPMLLVAALVGLVAALIAAAVPAWSAARLPTLVALSGRRPPSTPARRLLGFGLVLIAVALLCTVVAPVLGRMSGDTTPLLVLLVGAVAAVLGFGACSPWLLERLEGPARRLPLAGRIAVRDTARARTRNGPIVTAVLASVAGTIALAAILASQQAQNSRLWSPQMASDSMIIRGSQPETAAARVAQELGAVAWAPERWADGPGGGYQVVMPLLHPQLADDLMGSTISILVGDGALLTTFHAEAGIDALQRGEVVVLEARDFPVTGARGPVLRYTDGGTTEMGTVPVTILPLYDEGADGQRPMASLAIMSARVAASLDVVTDPGQVQSIVRLGHDVTQSDMDRAASVAVAVDPVAYVEGPLPPPDPMLPFRYLMLVASLLAALTVTGIAVALGEVEARGDQRTLLALGAPRGLRRRITAARGLVIALLAGLLAIPAGLLPVWGVLFPRGWPIVVPVPEVTGALLILPLAAVAGGILLGRPLPEWAARRDSSG